MGKLVRDRDKECDNMEIYDDSGSIVTDRLRDLMGEMIRKPRMGGKQPGEMNEYPSIISKEI